MGACWKVSVDGGPSQKIISASLSCPRVSPDGKLVAGYFRPDQTAKWHFATFALSSETPIQTMTIPPPIKFGSLFTWMPDGKSLAVIDTRNAIENLWALTLADESSHPLTNFVPDLLPLTIHNFSWSPDKTGIALARGSNVVDAVKIDYK